MSKAKWFKFYHSDFLTGIRNLEQIEVTAYIIVLCELYDAEGICRRNDADMSDRCRMRQPIFTKALDGLITKRKIDCVDGMLSNKRVSEEIEKRLHSSLEKQTQRKHGRNMSGTRAKHEQREKLNGNNEIGSRVRPYKENRDKSLTTLEVSAEQGAVEEVPSPALAGFMQRRAERERSIKIRTRP